MINANEMVGVKYIPPTTRIGHNPNETDSKDKDFILTSIKEQKDYKYFDKWGNLWTIDEIWCCPYCKEFNPCSVYNFSVKCEHEDYHIKK